MTNEKETGLRRTLLWALVIAYSVALPHAIFIYDVIVKHSSEHVAGKIPIAIILLLGTLCIFAGLFIKNNPGHMIFLMPCAIIVYAIFEFEPNPNKYIHIPEYIILSWILFEVLHIDYSGRGILALVFVCAVMLGVVDEIEQGIYPNRFYGWKDMLINAASGIIGVLTIIGLRPISGDWEWIFSLRKLKKSIGLVIFGSFGALFMCIYLFQVKKNLVFWGVYPIWLIMWNILFLLLGPGVVVYHCKQRDNKKNMEDHSISTWQINTARFWVLCPLVILVIIPAHAIWIAFSGVAFV